MSVLFLEKSCVCARASRRHRLLQYCRQKKISYSDICIRFVWLFLIRHEVYVVSHANAWRGGGVVSKLLRVHKLLQSGDCSKMVGLVLFDCKSRVLIAHWSDVNTNRVNRLSCYYCAMILLICAYSHDFFCFFFKVLHLFDFVVNM